MANSITKYATANCNICNNARTACCKTLGRKRWAGTTGVAVVAVRFLLPSALLADDAMVLEPAVRFLRCCATMKRSYSLPARRRNSKMTTRRITPMQEPAKAP